VHIITRVLLYAELIGAALVTILSIIILIRLGIGASPGDQHLSWQFLALPKGTDVTTIAGAAVFGFLAFAGFEGAATLGEETTHPKRDIPRAIMIAVTVVGAFYLLTIIAQTLGYGTSDAEVKHFVSAGAPFGDLGRAYVGAWLADLLTLSATVSLFAISVGTLSGAGRVLFALARGAGMQGSVARVARNGAPIIALFTSAGLATVIMIIERLTGADVLDATFWSLTIGTIALLVAYALATLGAIRFLFFGGRTSTPKWQIVVPILAFALVLYTLYKNTVGVEPPYTWFPYLVLVWLLLGIGISFRPGLAERTRRSLESSDVP
jgi:amino acid transporter